MILLISLLLNAGYQNLVDEYLIAHQLFLQENYPEATRYFNAILDRYGDSEFGDEIRFRLAECYFNLKDYEKAKENFKKVLARGKFVYLRPECLYALGLISVLQNNFKDAEEILQKLVKDPAYQEEERANFALGVLYYFRDNYEEAKQKLEGNNLLEAKFYYGKVLSRLKDPLGAIKVFKEILNEAPNTPIAVIAEFSRAEALFFNKDFDGARIKFQDFIINFPKSSLVDYAHYFLSASLIHGGEYAIASEHLLPLTRHPDNLLAAHSNYLLGICRMNLADGLGSVSSFQRVRANYPNTQIASYANLQLTNALLASGDTIQALVSSSQLATMFATGELASVGEYLTAMIYFQTNDYINAARFFELLLQRYPNSALREPAASLLLYSLNNIKNFDRAVTLGSKYLKDFPQETSPWRGKTLYFLADAFYYKASYLEAEKRWLESIEKFSHLEIGPYAKLGFAYSIYNQRRYKEAYEIFNSMSRIPFEDSSLIIATYLGLGYTQFNQGEYFKALDAFEGIYNVYLKDERCGIPGLFYAGMCYYNLEYYSNAIEAWEKLIRSYPMAERSAEAGFRTGDTYFKALEYEKARALFRWVVENHPLSEFARSSQLAIAQGYYNQRNFDEAIREFQKFLDLFPTSPEAVSARKGMEMCYYQKGLESTEAMQLFVEKFPQSELAADGQYQIAHKYFDGGDYKQAIDEFLKVGVNFPNSSYAPDALLLAAECALNLKNWERTIEIYTRYLNYYPQGKERDGVYFNLATSYFSLKDYANAMGNFKAVVDSFPNSSYVVNAQHNVDVCKRLLGEVGTVSTTEEIKMDSLDGVKDK